MNRIHLSLRTFLAALGDASHVGVTLGRLLISLIGVFMPIMLWTERITTFDRFFQGGQDCEMSLLALLAFLCMVILVAQRSRQSMILRLAVLCFYAFVLQLWRGSAISRLQTLNFLSLDASPSPFPGASLLPLRI